jgi:hypothetical protein
LTHRVLHYIISDASIGGGEMKARSCRTVVKEIKTDVLESHNQINKTGPSLSCPFY